MPVVTFTVHIPLCYVTKALKQKYRSPCTTILLKVRVKGKIYPITGHEGTGLGGGGENGKPLLFF